MHRQISFPVFLLTSFLCAQPGSTSIGSPVAGKAVPDENSLLLIGGLGASALYTSYLAIGAIGDVYANNGYEDEKVADLMNGMISTLTMNRNRLMAFGSKVTLEPADAATVQDMIAINDLLIRQAEGLRGLVTRKTDAEYEKYESSRKAAWDRIRKLLGE